MRSHRPVRSENPMSASRTLVVAALAAAATLLPQMAGAQDSLKLAVGQRGNWASSVAEVGQRAGIFKKHGLTLDLLYTQGSGETQQAVIAESVDVGVAAGTMGAMSAFAKGAPVRIIAAETTGASDLYWYVKADSPIKSLTDTTEKNTIAYSTNGSSSHNIVASFTQELGAKAKPTATGGPPGTLTSVMSGQVDIGWAAPPFGLKESQQLSDGDAMAGDGSRTESGGAQRADKRADLRRIDFPPGRHAARSKIIGQLGQIAAVGLDRIPR